MESTQQSWLEHAVGRIISFVNLNNYRKIVLQLPHEKMGISFDLTSMLKVGVPQAQFYILFDSMKKSCCVDILGAQHVDYDCFVHFGKACFSSKYQENQLFIFDSPTPYDVSALQSLFRDKEWISQIVAQNIGYLLIQQQLYEEAKRILKDNQQLSELVQILRLPYDANQSDEYLIFGYHLPKQSENKNILIISATQDEHSFVDDLAFSLKSLSSKIGKQVYLKYLNKNSALSKISANFNNKRLMQRYSLISQIVENDIFGIVVSNISTSFCQKSLEKVKRILQGKDKKYFIFMMNNLNEVKLGNFPQIQVYIIISCFNNSLFSIKDFHKVAVTPIDVEIAFQIKQFQNYSFDLTQTANEEIKLIDKGEEKGEEKIKEETTTNSIEVHGKGQIELHNKMQTLDFYQQRQYKGLQFNEKKEIKKITKGKTGVAQKYTALQ